MTRLKVGTRILINRYDKPVKVLSLPDDLKDPKAIIRLEVQNRFRTKITAQLGHLINGEVKYVDKPL